ncbi:MAG: TMEM175 family protein [Acidobacteriaceae bacterium]
MKHRLTLFSDAVYAIIITLMVLDLRTPGTPGWHGWWHLLPGIGGYAATFTLLLVIWLHHNHMFSHVREINRAMFWFNGAALFFSSLLPLTLRSDIDHPHDPTAYIVYQVVAWNAMTCMTWFRLAASKVHGNDPGWKEWCRKRNRVAVIGTLQAVAFCALTFVYLPAAIAIYLAMLIFLIVSIDTSVNPGTMVTKDE